MKDYEIHGNFRFKKDETVNAVEFIYELLKGGDKDFFTKQEVFSAILRAMKLSDNKTTRRGE